MWGVCLCEQSGEYVGKLLAVFSDCEDLDDHESLQVLCRIFKAIVGLNDGTLLEVRIGGLGGLCIPGRFQGARGERGGGAGGGIIDAMPVTVSSCGGGPTKGWGPKGEEVLLRPEL